MTTALVLYKPVTPRYVVVDAYMDLDTNEAIMEVAKFVGSKLVGVAAISKPLVHAYDRCGRCDELHTYITVDGFCRNCL